MYHVVKKGIVAVTSRQRLRGVSNILPSEEAPTTTTDRRVHARERIRSLAYLDLGSGNGGVILDLSEGGLALAAAAKLIADKVLPMRFELPTLHDRIEARGRVVWLSESKKVAGIKFEELPDDALQKIRKWISTQQCANGEGREYSAQERETSEPVSVPDPAGPHEVASVASQKQQPSNTVVPPSLETRIEITMHMGDDKTSVQRAGEVSAMPSRKRANRRVHPRRSVSPLAAYVDLGPGNGGMVLNLSEGGLALTAAGKLVGDRLPRLRFELPNLQGWIEAPARIIWLSESKKEAGAKFEELSAGAITKIRNWISAQRGSEDCREATAQEVEWVGAPGPLALHQEAVLRPALRDRNPGDKRQARNTGVPYSSRTAPSASSVPGLWAAGEERESMLGRSGRSQTSERTWSRLAAIIVVVALISFGTGLLIDRHFNQGSAEGNVVQQAHEVNASSSTPAPDTASSAGTQAYNQANIGLESSAAGSSERSTSTSSSNLLPLQSEGLADKGTNPAPAGRRDEHAANTTSLRRKQEPLAYEGTHASAAGEPPTIERNRNTSAPLPRATLTRPIETTSPAREVVPPPINDTTPRGDTAFASQVAPVANETKNLTNMTANAASASPSVTITMPPFPSMRVPPELKSHPSRPGTSLQMGQLASRVELAYPPEAVRQRIEGTVKLHAIIGRDGAVESVVATGPPLLGEAASSAVRQWRYKPTILGGQPIEAEEDIVVVFRLSAQASASN